MSTHPLRALLDDAAIGKFPPADGLIDVVSSPGGLADVIVGLTGHFMLAADIDAAEVAARVPPGDFSLPMSAATLSWLAQRLESSPATFDALLCRMGDGTGTPRWLHEVDAHDHPRVERAGEPLWAQVAPGNAASLRALAAAGFVPVAAEVLFPRSAR